MKRFSPLVLVLVSLALLVCPGPGWGFDYGETAPDFALTGRDGKLYRLGDYRGQVVVLKLATTWCPTCKQQTKELEKLVDYFNENQIVLIDVFLQDTEAMVDEFLAGRPHPKNFVPLLDDGQVRKAYGVYLIPRLLIVDRAQKVRRDGSLATVGDLKSFLNKALESKAGT